MSFLKRSAMYNLQFWSSVLLGSSITYLGLLHVEPKQRHQDNLDTDHILEDLGYHNDCQWNLLKYIDIKGSWLNDLFEDFNISFWQESMVGMLSADMVHKFSTVLSSPWLCDSGGTNKLLKVIQQYGTRNTRLLMTDVIASLDLPESDDVQEILSSCDKRILVGLARLGSVDQSIWSAFETISKNKSEVMLQGRSIENHLKSLLLSLPLTGLDACTTWFTKSAILTGRSAKQHKRSLSWSFSGDSNLSFANNFSSMPPEQVELYYLKALSRHSMVPSHRQIMVENGILPILFQELQQRQNNLKIKWEIGRILGNLTLEEITHSDIVDQGILPILRSWLFSEDLTLSSHASRALANLDRDFTPDEFYEEGVYLLHPDTRQSNEIAVDVVFVHGLRGGPLKTWRQEGTGSFLTREQCWPKAWLVKDFPNTRVLMVEYDSSLSNWVAQCPSQPESCSLASRSKKIMKKLRTAGVGKRPVIWVTHSMGGLLVKQLLLYAQDEHMYRNMCDKTKGIVFYSTPHHGSSLASYSSQARYLLLPSVEVKELCQGSPYLLTLHTRFMELLDKKHFECLSIGETLPVQLSWMLNSVLVSKDSSDLGVGPYFSLDVNHINVCKASDPDDQRYTYTKNFIQKILNDL
ncbi:protein SERAC1-like isoform X3 [Actinia tenebrosa]|uniref:Protein SERAC1 n=1 Tax=Actinia tenebrosa TaxID=6105 RepID=A0A6P8IRT7_ACTTE|nr:protein SERAC1-like isoform X1 [Actinia tenebrosa]XP_031568962.1 protein SERAC1-like isoform X2 [Actinia tenebrosa]XP_031568963.1 protein SERAC1-like isoform X3 [Actinia tenebrosa]